MRGLFRGASVTNYLRCQELVEREFLAICDKIREVGAHALGTSG